VKAESDKRYEAVTYTINGVDKMDYFASLDDAHIWRMKRYEEYTHAGIEYAAVIYINTTIENESLKMTAGFYSSVKVIVEGTSIHGFPPTGIVPESLRRFD
jgi:hypothetical protein